MERGGTFPAWKKKMKRLKISIAMCTYRGERYLQEQLDSISRQTRLPDELIICDDNSPDYTLHIAQNFAVSAAFPVRIFRNTKNIGSTLNFASAIERCQGDCIVLADQDDVWHCEKLECLEEYFLNFNEVAAVFSNGNVVDDALKPLGYTLWDTFQFTEKHRRNFVSNKAFEMLLNHNVITGATMAFRASFRAEVFPIPPSWFHDAWLAISISAVGTIGFIDRCLIDYRQHASQQIGGLSKSVASKVQLSKGVLDYAEKINEFELLLQHIVQSHMVQNDSLATKVREKIRHLEFRNSVYRAAGISKSFDVVAELLRGRYHRYSNGLSSACKDLYLLWN